jgi:tetratricopeptide (TPR) repeat protein
MTPQAELFDRARSCHRGGDLRQAEQLYRQLLHAQPDHADAWQLLGAALQGQGRPADAVPAFQRAIQVRPESADAHAGLGRALAEQGRPDQAAAHFRHALRLRPDHAEALTGLGIALAGQGQLPEALAHLQQAAQVRPDYPPAWHNLGVALAQAGRAEEAVRNLEAALRLNPEYPEACYNLGNVLKGLRRRDEAIAQYRRALALRPSYAEAYNNLGLTLTEAGQPEEAVVILEQAVRLRPEAVEGHNNLGLAYAELGRWAEAEAAYREALRRNPGYPEAHGNLGNSYKEQGRLEEALACYQVALWLTPDSASTHYNRALAWLQQGDYAQGWPAYEWRWKRPSMPPRPFRQPRWDGTPLDGRTILLYCEQGLGDVLQFVRYAALVQEKGGQVVLECPGFLMPLLSSCPGVDQLVAEGAALPAFDVQAPLLSLPGLLGTTLATVPATVPYLTAPPERVERWAQELTPVQSFKVGIVWQGNPHHPWDRHRSVPLACFAPLAEVQGVRLFSLQKGPGVEQLQSLAGRFPVTELAPELDEEGGAFLDTTAIMKHLDLVVTSDTAAAHLAGALGVPVWLAVSQIADWRWLRGRGDTPWYPTLRLFWQRKLGDWAAVFEEMAAELRRLVGRAGGGRAVRVAVSPGELLDKLTILEIKAQRFTDAEKLADVRAERAALRASWEGAVTPSDELVRLTAALKAVNEALWEVEDGLRLCERAGDFGPRFVELARSVYRHNDERADLKRRINGLLGSPWGEQKEYAGSR